MLTPPFVFDAEGLTALFDALGLGWRERAAKEMALMADLAPLLNRRAGGRDRWAEGVRRMIRTPPSSSAKTDDAEQSLVPRMRFPEFRGNPRGEQPR